MIAKTVEVLDGLPVVSSDIMRHDPVAAFLSSRRVDAPVGIDLEGRGKNILKEGLSFLLRNHLEDQNPDFVSTQGGNEIRGLRGGALRYQSSEGEAFTWLSGIVPIEHSKDVAQLELSEEVLSTSSLYLLVSPEKPYDNSSRRETLLFATGASGLSRGKGYRRSGPARITDYNFFDAMIRKAKQAYPAPVT